MSSLFDWRTWTVAFKGKDVTMEIRPLKSKDIPVVLPFFTLIQKKMKGSRPDVNDMKVAFEDEESIKLVFETQGRSLSVLRTSVRNISGIDDSIETMCEEVYYLPLVIDILIRLITISKIGEVEEKNSEGLSGSATSDAIKTTS